jgi:large subunit ribosomal protein L52
VKISNRFYHSSKPLFYPGQDWRKKNGYAVNPNAYGPITDLPDYSFVDGRQAPPGPGKLRRAIEQKEITEKIIRLTSEVDFAVARRAKLDQEEAQATEKILSSKLKPKGKSQSKPSNVANAK